MRTYLCILSALGLFTCELTWAGETSKVEEMTFDLTPAGKVTVVADEGTIRVRSWDKDQVHLKITKRVWTSDRERAEALLEKLDVELQHSDDRLHVRATDYYNENRFRFSDIFDSSRWHGHSGHQIDFDLVVPSGVALHLRGDEGDVEVSGVTGEIDIVVDEGNVSLSHLKDVDLNLELDEGDVDVQHVLGDASSMYVRVDEGGIRMLDCRLQRLTIDTDEGDVILDGVTTTDCQVSSDEGDVEARLDVLSQGRCSVHTDEGDVFLSISEQSSVSLTIKTEDGRIRSELPFDIHKWGDDGEKLKGVLGDGLARVAIMTEEGNISVQTD